MLRSIKSKIIVSYVLLVVVSMLIIGAFFNYTARGYLKEQIEVNLIGELTLLQDAYKQQFKEIAHEIRDAKSLRERAASLRTLISKIRLDMKNKLQSLNLSSGVYLILQDKSGKYRYSYIKKLEGEGISGDLAYEIRSKLSNEVNKFKFNYNGKLYYAVSAPALKKISSKPNTAQKKPRTWFMVYVPMENVEKLNRDLTANLIIGMALSIIFAILLGAYFAGNIANPIKKLKQRARLLASRDFDSKLNIKTGDEIEELADTINYMALSLKEYDISQKRFLQNASHELKTPLMSIQGYAEGIKDAVFKDTDKALDIIIQESVRLKGIVEEIIYLSKLETMDEFYNMEEESLNNIINESVEKIQSVAFKKNIRINVCLFKDAKIFVDKAKMIQALINIIANCIRYAKSEIVIETYNDQKLFEIIIRDDGPGFSQDDADKIFERFYKGSSGDTGLGLAITKIIIEKHRATIAAYNSKAGGAEFKISFKINS